MCMHMCVLSFALTYSSQTPIYSWSSRAVWDSRCRWALVLLPQTAATSRQRSSQCYEQRNESSRGLSTMTEQWKELIKKIQKGRKQCKNQQEEKKEGKRKRKSPSLPSLWMHKTSLSIVFFTHKKIRLIYIITTVVVTHVHNIHVFLYVCIFLDNHCTLNKSPSLTCPPECLFQKH